MSFLQQKLDRKNARFWNEPCGTALARSIGVETLTPDNLRRFDEAYFSYYPYIRQYLFLDKLRGKRVLDIGVGYGTLGQRFVIAGSSFYGIDIAEEPVRTMHYRLRMLGKTQSALTLVASGLNLPFSDQRFDYVFAMGVIHHTGDARRVISEIHRVLVPGGRAVMMVYNRFSYRALLLPWYYLRFRFSFHSYRSFGEFFRALFDTNQKGEAAPHTTFFSKSQVREHLADFSTVQIEVQNCYPFTLRLGRKLITILSREKLLASFARVFGLDLYIVATK